MSKTRPFIHSFSSGEVTPKIDGRSNLEKYYSALKTMENFWPIPHGGAERRWGMRWAAEVKFSNKKTIVVPFQFSTVQAYILEFGDFYMRVYKDGGQVSIPSGGELITNGTFTADITGWTDLSVVGGSAASVGSRLRLTRTATIGSFGSVAQTFATTPGSRYLLKFDSFVNPHRLRIGTSIGSDDILSLEEIGPSAGQLFVFTAATSTTSIYFSTRASGGAEFTEIDDVTVKLATPFEIATPWAEIDLPLLQFAQSADVLYVVHPSYQPRKVTRTAHDAWTLREVVFNPPATFETRTDPAGTLTPGATSGNGVTFTASIATFLDADVGREIAATNGGRATITSINTPTNTIATADITTAFPDTSAIAAGQWGLNGSPNATATPSVAGPKRAAVTVTLALAGFRDVTDEGKWMYINNGIIEIRDVTSTTVATGFVIRKLDSSAAALGGAWSLEGKAWSAALGFPAAVAFHQSRLYFAGTSSRPQTIWGSVVGDFENFGRGVGDSDSVAFTIGSQTIDVIRWLYSMGVLFIGTEGGQQQISGGGSDDAITATNVKAKVQTSYGVSPVSPVRVGNSLIFIQRQKNRLRELAFDFNLDSFVSEDLNILADHLAESGTFEDLAYQQEPYQFAWAVRSDGQVPILVFNKTQKLIGWGRIKTQGSIESVAVIPHWSKAVDSVWVVVTRIINGNGKRYIEYFDSDISSDAALTRTATGTKVASVSNLTHLANQTVDIVGDDGVQTPRVVSVGGVVTIDPPADKIEVGLHYDSKLETLRIELATNPGGIASLAKRWSKIILRLFKSVGARVNGENIDFRDTNDLMDTGTPVFTGDKDITALGFDREGRIVVEQVVPRPLTVLAIFGDLNVDGFN